VSQVFFRESRRAGPIVGQQGLDLAWLLEEAWQPEAAVALQVFHYNFCRIYSSIRCTPAMRANLTDHIWKLDDLFGA
jgi:hypothetical protein